MASTTSTTAGEPFRDMAAVQAANRALGHCWFSQDSMAAFNTRIVGELIGGRWFVTSDHADGERARYTVRECSPDGDVHTARETEFMGYPTKHAARSAAFGLWDASFAADGK